MPDRPAPPAAPHPAKPCPICGAPAVAAFRPFCSRRCADVDLGRWLSGVYAVPAEPDDDAASADDSPSDDDRAR